VGFWFLGVGGFSCLKLRFDYRDLNRGAFCLDSADWKQGRRKASPYWASLFVLCVSASRLMLVKIVVFLNW